MGRPAHPTLAALAVAGALALAACLVALMASQEAVEAAFPGDNGKILFSSDPGFEEGCPSYIGSVNPDGTERTEVTPDSCSFFGDRGDTDPDASPDGRKIAFTRSTYIVHDIFVVNADGSGLMNVTNDSLGNFEPAWSPDGNKIAFTNGGADGDIYVANSDGSGEPRRITDTPSNEANPAWSPDGEKLAFTSNLSGDAEIYTMSLDGSEITKLTENTAYDSEPDWSPDGNKIVFHSFRDGKNAIYLMNADGSEEAKIPYELPCVDFPDVFDFCHGEGLPVWSPDGTKIAFIQFGASAGYDFGGGYIMNPDGSGVTNGGFGFLGSGSIDWAPAPSDHSAECTIKGTSGPDELIGTQGDDVVCGLRGKDTIRGRGGDDTLLGNGGKDILLDVKGKDSLKGGDANDVLFTLDDAPLDIMNGQSGSNDLCLGDRGDIRKNCERGSLLGLSGEQRERLDEAKDAAGL